MTPAELVDQVPLLAWLVVDAVAVYRITRLLTRDSIPLFTRPREALLRRWDGRALAELVVCEWCMSVYVGAAVVTARLTLPTAWSLLALVLAYSAVAGQLTSRE